MSAAITSNEATSDLIAAQSSPEGKPDSAAPEPYVEQTTTVREFVRHRSTSIREDISAGMALAKGIAASRGDKPKTEQFLAELIKAKAISKKEKQLGLYAKKTVVSMYTKIANYADIFDENTRLMLSTGYTTLYQAVNLYEDIEGSGEPNAAQRFREILKASDGPITKRFLIKERKKINGDPPGELVSQTSTGTEDVVQSEPVLSEQSESWQDAPFSAVLVSLKTADAQKLTKSCPGELPFCLRIHELRANDALLLVHARLRDLIGIADKLPCWGFARFEHVYLCATPQHPDAIEAEVLGVSRWGKPKMNLIESWSEHSDALALADTLLAEVGGKKIHLFAAGQREGWVSIVGDANWSVGNFDA